MKVSQLMQMVKKAASSPAIKSGFIYTASGIASRAVPFMLLPVFTRYLSPDEYGQIAMFQIIVLFFMPLIGFCSNSVLSQSFFKMNEQNRLWFVNDMYKIIVGGYVLFAILSWFAYPFLADLLHLSFFWVEMAMLVAFLGMISTITMTLFQLKKMPFNYGMFQFGTITINLVLSIGLVVGLSMGYQGRLEGILVSSLLVCLISIYWNHRSRWHEIQSFRLSYHVNDITRLGITLIPATIMGATIVVIDRVMLSSMMTIQDVGVYAVGLQFGQIVSIFSLAISIAWLPYFYEKMSSGEKKNIVQVLRITMVLTFVYLFIGTSVAIVGPLVLPIVVGGEFLGAGKVIPWLAFFFAFSAINCLLGGFLLEAKKNMLISMIAVVGLPVSVGLTYWFILWMGLVGAAQAAFYSSVFITLLLFVCCLLVRRDVFCREFILQSFGQR